MKRLIAVFVSNFNLIQALINLASLSMLIISFNISAALLEVEYDGFSIILDCEREPPPIKWTRIRISYFGKDTSAG